MKILKFLIIFTIIQIIIKIKNGKQTFECLPFCTLDEQEIQKVKVDLESLFSLKSLLISKGLYNNKCIVKT